MQNFKFVNWRIRELVFWCHEQVICKIEAAFCWHVYIFQKQIDKLKRAKLFQKAIQGKFSHGVLKS